jgi:hypothetical protein
MLEDPTSLGRELDAFYKKYDRQAQDESIK